MSAVRQRLEAVASEKKEKKVSVDEAELPADRK
jgi:hypothetical protein